MKTRILRIVSESPRTSRGPRQRQHLRTAFDHVYAGERMPDFHDRSAMTVITLVESVRLALVEEMQADPSVIVLGEDVGVHGGVFSRYRRFAEAVRRKPSDRYAAAELGIAAWPSARP